jgi:hypothetical protein
VDDADDDVDGLDGDGLVEPVAGIVVVDVLAVVLVVVARVVAVVSG